jgi:predicted nucleic acid-binding protein
VPSVLLDTGPLVALFRRNDSWHRAAVAWFRQHSGPLLTTHAVVTEAWHLLREPVRLSLVQFVTRACAIPELGPQGPGRVLHALERFADTPMDYADATLVVLAESERAYDIATLDADEFATYRTSDGKALKNVFRARR